MKRRILSALMALVMVAGLMTGCSAPAAGDNSSSEGTSQAELAPVSKDEIKVGFVYISDSSDMGYTYNHELGTKEMQEALGLRDDQIIRKYNVPEGAECDTALRELAESGCNIIFATSFGYEDYVKEVAAEYPNIQFCHATGYQAASSGLSNFHNYFASIYEARYLAGIAAGLKTETNKLGYVAAYPFAEVISGYTAFYLGAKSVNPDVTMYVNYTNEWSDATKEATNAKALIDQGCDVISQHSDTSAPATTAQNNGVFAVGYNDDMIPVAPDAALVSARVNWGAYYEYALKCLIDGEAIDQDWCGSYAEGACYLSPFNDAIIADGTKEAIEKAAAGLADGSVQVFAGPLHGKDADGNELNLAEGEYYKENEKGSSPTFTYIVDGVTVLS